MVKSLVSGCFLTHCDVMSTFCVGWDDQGIAARQVENKRTESKFLDPNCQKDSGTPVES